MSAWDAGDGTAFASAFTENADFVPYFGIHVQGREGIADAHQPIFDGFMKGSKLRYELQSIRPIEKNVFIVHTLGKAVQFADKVLEIDQRNVDASINTAISAFWLTTAANNRYDGRNGIFAKAEQIDSENPLIEMQEIL